MNNSIPIQIISLGDFHDSAKSALYFINRFLSTFLNTLKNIICTLYKALVIKIIKVFTYQLTHFWLYNQLKIKLNEGCAACSIAYFYFCVN